MRLMVACTLLLAALSSTACHTKKSVTMDQLHALQPERAWVTGADQSVVLIRGPQVIGDTLAGYINGVYEEMPATHLKQVMVEAPATTRTVLLVGAITVGLGGMIYALLGTSSGEKYVGSDYCEEHPEDPACAAL
jgi:FlaG/FlaF family flagellin (archaellin)